MSAAKKSPSAKSANKAPAGVVVENKTPVAEPAPVKKVVTKKPASVKPAPKAVVAELAETKSPELELAPVKKVAEKKVPATKAADKVVVGEVVEVKSPAPVPTPVNRPAEKKPAAAKKAVAKPSKEKMTGVIMTDPKITKEAVEAAVNAGKETVESVVKAGTEAASQGVEQAVAMSQEQVAAAVKAGSEVFENYEDVIAFNKENFDAVVSANTSLVQGIQAFNTEFFAIAQASLEQNAKATQKFFACKSVQEVVAVQNDLVKSNYSAALDKSRKLSDLGVKVAENSTAPLAARVNVAVEKITKPLAA